MTRNDKRNLKRADKNAIEFDRKLDTPTTPAGVVLDNRGGEEVWSARANGMDLLAGFQLSARTCTGENYHKTTLSLAASLFDRLLDCAATGNERLSYLDLSSPQDVRQLSATALRLAIKMDEGALAVYTTGQFCEMTGCALSGMEELEVNACGALEGDFCQPHLFEALDRLRENLSLDCQHLAVAEYLLFVTLSHPCYYGMDVKFVAAVAGKAAANVLRRKWKTGAACGWGKKELGIPAVNLIRVASVEPASFIRSLYPLPAGMLDNYYAGKDPTAHSP
ncbi:hypothetical protein HDU89_000536 [Geranomyces variabilis]|nr:hypothetical protein HDU89_000536 [Geranomyces variabilis]